MLQIDGATLVIEEEKAEAAFNYFSEVLGSPHYREGLLESLTSRPLEST
jgi:hypothetical protein